MADRPDLTGVTLTGEIPAGEVYHVRLTLKNGSPHPLEIDPVATWHVPYFLSEAVNAATGEEVFQLHLWVQYGSETAEVPPGGTFVAEAPLTFGPDQIWQVLAEAAVVVSWHCGVPVANLGTVLEFRGQVVIPRLPPA